MKSINQKSLLNIDLATEKTGHLFTSPKLLKAVIDTTELVNRAFDQYQFFSKVSSEYYKQVLTGLLVLASAPNTPSLHASPNGKAVMAWLDCILNNLSTTAPKIKKESIKAKVFNFGTSIEQQQNEQKKAVLKKQLEYLTEQQNDLTTAEVPNNQAISEVQARITEIQNEISQL